MTQEAILAIGQQAILIMLVLAGPILIVSLVVGLLVSVFQAVTQIREQTLTFIPKILATVAVLVVGGPWMLDQLLGYPTDLWGSIPTLIG